MLQAIRSWFDKRRAAKTVAMVQLDAGTTDDDHTYAEAVRRFVERRT